MARPAGLSGARLGPVLALSVAIAGGVDGQRIFLHGTSGGIVPCAACHGADGHGRSAPAVAGLSVQGVLTNLDVLATGGGDNAVMQREARGLSPAERNAVAGYIATLR